MRHAAPPWDGPLQISGKGENADLGRMLRACSGPHLLRARASLSISAELSLSAVRAVRDRLSRFLVGDVDPPPLRRHLPLPAALDALEYLGGRLRNWFGHGELGDREGGRSPTRCRVIFEDTQVAVQTHAGYFVRNLRRAGRPIRMAHSKERRSLDRFTRTRGRSLDRAHRERTRMAER